MQKKHSSAAKFTLLPSKLRAKISDRFAFVPLEITDTNVKKTIPAFLNISRCRILLRKSFWSRRGIHLTCIEKQKDYLLFMQTFLFYRRNNPLVLWPRRHSNQTVTLENRNLAGNVTIFLYWYGLLIVVDWPSTCANPYGGCSVIQEQHLSRSDTVHCEGLLGLCRERVRIFIAVT